MKCGQTPEMKQALERYNTYVEQYREVEDTESAARVKASSLIKMNYR